MKFLTVYLNGIPMEMLFDTGVSHLALTDETMRKIGINEIIGETKLYTVYGVFESKPFNISSVRLRSREVQMFCGQFGLHKINYWM